MPIDTWSELTYTATSGLSEVVKFSTPVYEDEHGWTSHWTFSDISSGSGLDSRASNHLEGSGGPSQVAGWTQESGVQFDGVDDCFFLDVNAGSGLEVAQPHLYDILTSMYTQFGFMCRMYVDSTGLDQDRYIMSKWNEVGNDREFGVGINPSGGVFVMMKRYTGTSYGRNLLPSGIVPTDEWFNFGFFQMGRGSSNSVFTVYINDDMYVHDLNSFYPDRTGSNNASGVFCIGAADIGLNPSGFFKGRMEDFRWFTSKSCPPQEWNAFASGIEAPTITPALNEFHPDLIAHWPLDAMYSGVIDESDGQYYIEEKFSGEFFPSSGSSSQFDHDYYRMMEGPHDRPSGIEQIDPTQQSQRYFTKHNLLMPDKLTNTNNGNFTVSYWIFKTNTGSSRPFGWRMLSVVRGPWLMSDAGGYQGFYIGIDTSRPSYNPSYVAAADRVIASGQWAHVMCTFDLGRQGFNQSISGVNIGPDDLALSGQWLFQPWKGEDTQNFRIFHQLTNTTSYAHFGGLSEIVVLNRALNQQQMTEFYTESSGFLGYGAATSGLQGGWTLGLDTNRGSGSLGGYILVGSPSGNTLGGYTSGVPAYTSGMMGSYVIVGTPNEQLLGNWMTGKNNWDAPIGGFAARSANPTALLGVYTVGQETLPVTSDFFAFFNIVGRDKDEFDAQVALFKALSAEFDAQAIVYTEEQKPGVNIILPAVATSSGNPGDSWDFEAEASGLDGKHIVATAWFFTDEPVTSGSNNSASGTYTTSHTFAASGEFDVVFVAIDSEGLVNSDRVRVNTASGVTLPQVELTATPESGTAPLEVAFSGTISSVPANTSIIEKYLQFGDGTFSASTDSIYKLYPVVGCYLPTLRVRDSRGYIVTDTTVVGANN